MLICGRAARVGAARVTARTGPDAGTASFAFCGTLPVGEELAVSVSQPRASTAGVAKALGARSPRVILLHVLPNVINPVIVMATLVFMLMA